MDRPRLCHWFFGKTHNWLKWEQYEWRGQKTYIQSGATVWLSERRQRRVCDRCGKEQDELVREG